jgi:HSP20 family protein
MAPEKIDPVKELVSLRDSVSKVIGQSIQSVTKGVYPLMDIYETQDSVIIKTSPLDGVIPDSLEVAMEEDMLTLQGETGPDEDIPKEAYLQRERRFGRFERTVRIPRPVVAEAAEAKFKEGILIITLPKTEDSRPHVINVTSTD